jgi:hypothetical protein
VVRLGSARLKARKRTSGLEHENIEWLLLKFELEDNTRIKTGTKARGPRARDTSLLCNLNAWRVLHLTSAYLLAGIGCLPTAVASLHLGAYHTQSFLVVMHPIGDESPVGQLSFHRRS